MYLLSAHLDYIEKMTIVRTRRKSLLEFVNTAIRKSENNHFCTTEDDYSIREDDVTVTETLEVSGNAIIRKCLWRQEEVCVKSLPTSDTIHNEVHVLSKCIHPRICQFLGAYDSMYDGNQYTNLVFEYMDNGSLHDYLAKTKLDNNKKCIILEDVAKALIYLHNRRPELIMHRDMKPNNILITRSGRAKVADFGISKLVKNNSGIMIGEKILHTGEIGSYLWMSPEVLSHETYNQMSDIYSFGLIIYKVFSESEPWEECNLNAVQHMYAKHNRALPEIRSTGNTHIDSLVKQCISYNPTDRPTANDILVRLTYLRKNDII